MSRRRGGFTCLRPACPALLGRRPALRHRQLGKAAAYGYVVLLLGGSAATLGLIGFLNTIPNLVFALPAGALADRYDRRKLLLIFQLLNMALAAALAVTWATGTLTIGLLGVLAVLGASLGRSASRRFRRCSPRPCRRAT